MRKTRTNFLCKVSLVILLGSYMISNTISAQAASNYKAKLVTDTLILKNKDQIVGEIKNMDRGILTIETDYSDSDFTVKWLDVISINSHQNYLILLRNGHRLNSDIKMSTKDSTKIILTEYGIEQEKQIRDIVYLKAVESKIVSRFSASLSFGANFTKSNNLLQLSITSDLSYTADKWLFTGKFNTVRSSQDEVDPTERTDGNVGIKYFLENKNWYIRQNSDFLSNDEQQLKLRSAISAGAGRFFVKNNTLQFGAGLGLVYNIESFNDVDNSSRNSVEGYISLEVDIFDFGDLNLKTDITGYPSITEGGRFRTDFNFNLKYDLPFDFFIKLGFTYNYDNEPIADASKTDYVFQSTFGWEFN